MLAAAIEPGISQLTQLLELDGRVGASARCLAGAVAGRALEPNAAERLLAETLSIGEDDVVMTGPLERRVLLVRQRDRAWAGASLSGQPLASLPWPEAVARGLSWDCPSSDVSSAQVTHDAEVRLLRPRIKLVALYHPENFPLPRFPLGISDLARAVRTGFMGKVSLSDMQLGLSLDEVVDEIERYRPDILGVSATFGQHDVLVRLLDRLARHATASILVFGGSLVALNERLLLNRYPDAFVARGAGEPTIADIVGYWHGDMTRSQVRNVSYLGSGLLEITKRVSNREYNDIAPELDLLRETLDHHGVMQLESSRGCTHACSFCPREHKGIWQGDDPTHLAMLLDDLTRVYHSYPHIARKVFLVDEEFIGHDRNGEAVERARDVAQRLHTAGFRWETSSRVDQVYRPDRDREWHLARLDLWRELKEMGLDRCLFGVESGVDSILRRFNKRSTARQNAIAIRILTALGVPIRCTYITFDQLMTFEELVASYRFQGRRDVTLRSVHDARPEQLLDIVQDDDAVEPYLADVPFYAHISYMLVSMECLLGSPYLRMVEKAGLAREVLPSMGRRNAAFQEPLLGLLSDWSQRWVDRNFSLDYTLKSFEKVTERDEQRAVRCMRLLLKESAYTFLGRMLFLCLGDEGLLASEDPGREHFALEFASNLLDAQDVRGSNEALRQLADLHFGELTARLDHEVEPLLASLDGSRVPLLGREHGRWRERAEWHLINSPEQCVAQ